MSKKTVLLLSGGLDSSALLFWAMKNNFEVLPLIVNYGQKTFQGEWRATQSILESAHMPSILPLSVEGIYETGLRSKTEDRSLNSNQYFPSRNTLLICLAAMYAYSLEINLIMIGLIKDVSHILPDCSEEFIKKCNSLLRIEYPKLTISAPFINRYKTSIVKESIDNGLNPRLTFCCNRLSENHCWACPSCLDRQRVFSELNIQC